MEMDSMTKRAFTRSQCIASLQDMTDPLLPIMQFREPCDRLCENNCHQEIEESMKLIYSVSGKKETKIFLVIFSTKLGNSDEIWYIVSRINLQHNQKN